MTPDRQISSSQSNTLQKLATPTTVPASSAKTAVGRSLKSPTPTPKTTKVKSTTARRPVVPKNKAQKNLVSAMEKKQAKPSPAAKVATLKKTGGRVPSKGNKRSREVEEIEDSNGDDDSDGDKSSEGSDVEPTEEEYDELDKSGEDEDENEDEPPKKKQKTSKGAVRKMPARKGKKTTKEEKGKGKGKAKEKSPIPEEEMWKYSQGLCDECCEKNLACVYRTPTDKSCIRCKKRHFACEKVDPATDRFALHPQSLLATIKVLQADVAYLKNQVQVQGGAVVDLLKNWGDAAKLKQYGLEVDEPVAGPSRRRGGKSNK